MHDKNGQIFPQNGVIPVIKLCFCANALGRQARLFGIQPGAEHMVVCGGKQNAQALFRRLPALNELFGKQHVFPGVFRGALGQNILFGHAKAHGIRFHGLCLRQGLIRPLPAGHHQHRRLLPPFHLAAVHLPGALNAPRQKRGHLAAMQKAAAQHNDIVLPAQR